MPQTTDFSKQCIYTALLQLMEIKPYKEITITDITKRAGVSRMAYYRNYNSKNDILLQQLHEQMSSFQEQLYDNSNITEQQFWSEYFWRFCNEPIVAILLEANLLEYMSHIHVESIYMIFSHKFHWDISKEENRMLLYSRIGAVVGLIRFSVENDGIINKSFVNDILGHYERYK